MNLLLYLAVLPVIGLGYYIYKKDTHKEPSNLLAKIFGYGCLSVIPIVICEKLLDTVFPTEGVANGIILFINVFVTIALVEEGFKWLVTKKFGYNSDSFDEVYDVIVYAVFASLGFACIENILYVFSGGIGTAIGRALLSIPGHTCFGVLMGSYLAKAKIAHNNGNNSLYTKNIILSILIPALGHAAYDFFLMYIHEFEALYVLVLFFAFFIALVIYCFNKVKNISTMQQNLTTAVSEGVIKNTNNVVVTTESEITNCPICGKYVKGFEYCPYCGIKLKK